MSRFIVALLSFLSIAASAFAVQPDEVLKNPVLEARARDLSAGLRCLVCQNQSIDDSDAPLARDLRLLIRERLVAGESDDQVMGFIVGRYGEFVLLKPRLEAKTIMLWAGPFALLSIASLIVLLRYRAGSRGSAESPLSGEERAAFDRLVAGSNADETG